jgi:hypothetical protein
MSAPFFGRTPLPLKQQVTMSNKTTALLLSLWKLTSLHTAETPTRDAPLFSPTYLDSYFLDWSLQVFPHVLNVIRQPLLESLHNHIVYHTSTNRSDVTLASNLRFARLLVGNTGSPRVKGTMQDVFVMESGKNGSTGFIWNIGEALMLEESRIYLGNYLLER